MADDDDYNSEEDDMDKWTDDDADVSTTLRHVERHTNLRNKTRTYDVDDDDDSEDEDDKDDNDDVGDDDDDDVFLRFPAM